MEIACSVHEVPIGLTDERWAHIVEDHDEMAGRMSEVLSAIEQPDWVTRGRHGALIAWKTFGPRRFPSVIYRETGQTDGFVITAFLTSKAFKRRRIWP